MQGSVQRVRQAASAMDMAAMAAKDARTGSLQLVVASFLSKFDATYRCLDSAANHPFTSAAL